VVNLYIVTFKRKRLGPKYQGTVLFMKMMELKVMPDRVHNFYRCKRNSETTPKYVRVSELCTLLAEVDDHAGVPNMSNLIPIAHAFPISWISE